MTKSISRTPSGPNNKPPSLWHRWNNQPIWLQIIVAMVLGLSVGGWLGESAQALKPIGTLFVNAIKMLIVPLVFCSLVVGVTAMEDTAKMGRIGIKTLALYLATTTIAITLGLLFGYVVQPGSGISLVAQQPVGNQETPSLINTIVALIPQNPVESMARGDILQIIIFALALGISLSLTGEKGKPAIAVFTSLAEAMYKLTELVMKCAPYGVFGLMAWLAGTYGVDVLLPLLKVIVAVYIATLLHLYGFYGFCLKALGKVSPLRFFKVVFDAQMIAFTTSSSAGTLPMSLHCSRRLGASASTSCFILPLGATINMDGTALYQGVTALFIAQAYGIDLSTADYLTIIATATLASIGTAGIPGGGLIMLTLVLTTVGLPVEGVALIAGIDRILDMARTTVNITGDIMVNILVSKSEDELDIEVFDGVKKQDTTT
ncbi:dicarboxylate/amino acid:cation symporter [Sansalvadorimonas verongulae]|uniref:dicarboxylate/amino acid:cation symporter n=1 Tax=Sansalvadorimonas verongulae TaxID=2172824 RepID=UPI0012BB7895|nr:dicarboxylate/amino acid:cation symporter [Sansalvadorimonas verongulae]MTI15069.1 dicarboxylate/amino acid:cation symporter [Sansalvadorimonas verongulae]